MRCPDFLDPFEIEGRKLSENAVIFHLANGELASNAIARLDIPEEQRTALEKQNFQNAVHLCCQFANLVHGEEKDGVACEEIQLEKEWRRAFYDPCAVADWLQAAAFHQDFPESVNLTTVRDHVNGLRLSFLNMQAPFTCRARSLENRYPLEESGGTVEMFVKCLDVMDQTGIKFGDPRLKFTKQDMAGFWAAARDKCKQALRDGNFYNHEKAHKVMERLERLFPVSGQDGQCPKNEMG